MVTINTILDIVMELSIVEIITILLVPGTLIVLIIDTIYQAIRRKWSYYVEHRDLRKETKEILKLIKEEDLKNYFFLHLALDDPLNEEAATGLRRAEKIANINIKQLLRRSYGLSHNIDIASVSMNRSENTLSHNLTTKIMADKYYK